MKNISKKQEMLNAVGRLYGGHIHVITHGSVNDNFNRIREEDRLIAKDFQFCTVKSAKVNSLRTMEIEGGVTISVVNGGEKEHRIYDKPVFAASEYKKSEDSSPVFGNYAAAAEIANAVNKANLSEVREAIAELKKMESFLVNAISENEKAAIIYEQD